MSYPAYSLREKWHGQARRLRARATLWLDEDRLLIAPRRALSLALFGVGVFVCVRFYRTLEWPVLLGALRRAGPAVVLLLLAPLVGNFVHMLGWRALLPRELKPDLWRAFRIFVAAQAGNEVGLGVLGESIKVAALPPERRGVATRAVVLDNLSALVALVAVIVTVGACAWRGASIATDRWVPVVAVAGGLSVVACGIIVYRRRSSGQSSLPLLIAFLAHYLGKLWIIAEFALALWILASASARASALLGLASTLASFAGALVPGQLGVVEAALVGSAGAVQLTRNTVLGVAVLRRIRGLVWIALGLVFFSDLFSKSEVRKLDASIAVGR